MSYSYAEERALMFTDDGQRLFLRIRDKVEGLFAVAGACSVRAALRDMDDKIPFNPRMACLDRLCELGEAEWVRGDSFCAPEDMILAPCWLKGRGNVS